MNPPDPMKNLVKHTFNPQLDKADLSRNFNIETLEFMCTKDPGNMLDLLRKLPLEKRTSIKELKFVFFFH